MAENDQAVNTRTFRKAETLLDALSTRNKTWKGSLKDWVFRGHEDATFELLPTTLRRSEYQDKFGPFANGPHLKSGTQIHHEFRLVHHFEAEVDRNGLRIPVRSIHRYFFHTDDSLGNDKDSDDPSPKSPTSRRKREAIRQQLFHCTEPYFGVKGTFPPNEVFDAFALAQHYGIPTRLLDWTTEAGIACYFAAHRALEKLWAASEQQRQSVLDNLNKGENNNSVIGLPDHIGIWCLNRHVVGIFLNEILQKKGESIDFIWPIRAENPNLMAQKGLLTLHNHVLGHDTPPDRRPLDVIISEADEKLVVNPDKKGLYPIMRHYKLPFHQAIRLHHLLDNENVTAATLFPGYFGVAKCQRERQIRSELERRGH